MQMYPGTLVACTMSDKLINGISVNTKNEWLTFARPASVRTRVDELGVVIANIATAEYRDSRIIFVLTSTGMGWDIADYWRLDDG